MANPTCTYQGFGSSLTSFLCNATSGNLSQTQVDQLKADTAAQIRQASAGIQPAAQDVLVARAMAEIDTTLSTLSLPGETGGDMGASPDQSGLRIPGTGVIDLAKLKQIIPSLPDLTNLKWYVLGAGLLVGAFFAFPYIAPGLARNFKAARLLRG
jgi:hypothetical protein